MANHKKQFDRILYLFCRAQSNSSKHGINHWIPFIEWDVEANDKFDSHFMTDFINGKMDLIAAEPNLFYNAGAGTGGGGAGKIEPKVYEYGFLKA